MQILPPQYHHYLPLVVLLPLSLAETATAHLALLALQLLLRPSTTQNYCNAAASILLTPLLLLQNVMEASSVIYS